MKQKKISYITLISDLYLLLAFSYIIYGIKFGFVRIGNESFNLFNITNDTALIISIYEIIICILNAYLLHKCNKNQYRYITIILCVLNIIYRIINILVVLNIYTGFILSLNIILLLLLIFYKK